MPAKFKKKIKYSNVTKKKKKINTKKKYDNTKKRSVCNQVACNYFFNKKCANQRAIVQQENEIHRVTGLDA